MNLILLFEDDFVSEDRVRLVGRRHQHVRKVHRASIGDRLVVGRYGGEIGSGVIVHLDRASVELDVRMEREAPPRMPVVLALALPRPPMLRRVLQSSASMGVERLVLFHSQRVERTFWNARALAPEAMREQLVLGCEQGVDTRLPELELCPRTRPFLEERLPELAAGRRCLVPDPSAKQPCPRALQEPVCLVLGPEGGLVPPELEEVVARGFEPVELGERILRVEVAVPAVLARLF